MKKLLFFMLSIVMTRLASAQTEDWLPMLEEGRTWNVVSLHPADEETATYKDLQGNPCIGIPYSYFVKGETDANGRTYERIFKQGSENVIFLLRQQDSQVFRTLPDTNAEQLVYDFSLNEGDIFVFDKDAGLLLRVDKAEIISIDGIERRVLWMKYYTEDFPEIDQPLADIWVEGIGGVVTAPCCMEKVWATTESTAVEECMQNGESLFSFNDFSTLATSISLDNVEVAVGNLSDFYNLQGHRLTREPDKGLFIKDGRKYLKR